MHVSDRGSADSAVSPPCVGHSRQGVSDAIFDCDDDSNWPYMTSIQCVKDQLTTTVLDAVRYLPTGKQAAILLDTSLALIEAGQCGGFRVILSNFSSSFRRYGDKVEEFLEVYLKTPGLPQEDVTKALLARGAARRAAGERLMVKAQQGTHKNLKTTPSEADRKTADIRALSRLDPSNRQVKSLLQLSKQVRPPSVRLPTYLNRFSHTRGKN